MGRIDIDYSLSYRGLYIEATFSPKVPATEVDPPDGGELQSLSWTVEDADEVGDWLDMGNTQAYDLAQEFRYSGFFPATSQHSLIPPGISPKLPRTTIMTPEQYEALYSPQILCDQLDQIVKSQTPAGMNPEVGMVMDVVETTDSIQMWLMEQMAAMRDHKWQDAAQYLSATASVVAVSAIVIHSVVEAVVDGE
mgnify:CR=1 FL=1|tara:strand:- start:6119 stop:6700 length:582 start_codon:yes stop_codon:yes gene_type:complete